MSATGYTPILLYASGTATNVPLAANLTSSASGAELALNYADGKLFYKDSGGVVQVLATKAAAAGIFSSVTITGGSINGTTVGATTASTGAFTTLAASGAVTLSGGTANGVAYLNGSKVLTTGTAFGFNGTNVSIGTTNFTYSLNVNGPVAFAGVSGTSPIAVVGNNGTVNYLQSMNAAFNAYPMGIFLGSTERMRFDTSGNVGIGTSVMTGTGNLFIGGASSSIYYNNASGSFNVGTTTATNLTLGTNNLVRVTVDSAGNMGLGVTPSAWGSAYKPLQMGSSAFSGSVAAFVGNAQTFVTSNAHHNGTNWIYTNTSGAGYYQIAGVSNGAHIWYNAPFGTAGAAITFTQAMTLDASGNLGVGTTSPAARLDVKGGTTISTLAGWNTLSNSMFELANPAVRFGIGYDSSDQVLLQAFDTSNAARSLALQVYGGNVGIGTSSPAYKLDVAGTIRAAGVAATAFNSFYSTGTTTATNYGAITNSGNTLIWGVDSSVGGAVTGSAAYASFIGSSSAYPLELLTSGTVRATLDISGNLGLGVTPSAWTSGWKALQIGATSALTDVSNTSSYWNNTYVTGASSPIYQTTAAASFYRQTTGQHLWYNAPSGTAGAAITFTQAMTLDASGNFVVGATSAGNTNSNSFWTSPVAGYCGQNHVSGTGNGTVYMYYAYNGTQIGSVAQAGTTGVLYNITSDYRLKDIDGPVTNSGAFIDKLNPVQGSWKADGSRFIGFLAHELQEASETVVGTGEKDGEEMQSIDYSNAELIANLVAEIQSLRKRLAAAGI